MKPRRGTVPDTLQAKAARLEERLRTLQRAVEYAVNRLDSQGAQPQVAADLAVALAYSRSSRA